MSHLKERKEKQCLNCNAVIYGRFCHVCGQENVEPKESFLHLLRHFIEDITHFDGKFFDTLRYLIMRPGFLSYEYMRGRRNSYLNPIRMYIFTSAIFFLIYFSVNKSEHKSNGDSTHTVANKLTTKAGLFAIGDSIKANIAKEHVIDSLLAVEQLLNDSIIKTKDPVEKEKLVDKQKTIAAILKVSRAFIGSTTKLDTTAKRHSPHEVTNADTSRSNRYSYKKANDDAAAARVKTKDTAVKKHLQDLKNVAGKKDIIVEDVTIEETKAEDDEPDTASIIGALKDSDKEKAKHNVTKDKNTFEGFLDGLSENREEVKHKIPQVMFITLPFMALILQLLYRKLKQFYYVNHIIFIINLYIGVYLLILVELGLDYLYNFSHFELFNFLSSIVGIGIFLYVYKSLRNFYHQGRIKTFMKCILLYCMFFIVAVISFLLVAALPFSLSH